MRRRIKRWFRHVGVEHFPRLVIDKLWKKEQGHTVDWDHPRDLNEKIEWLICYGDTSQWPLLADKYRVREYLEKKGYGHLLTRLYGVWEDASLIDFDALPERFVLKCNHDSASYFIIDKKEGFDKEKVIRELNAALRRRFGDMFCEPHYNKIKPMILAEEFLEQDDKDLSTSLIDYKVWCFDGKPYCIWTCRSRDKGKTYVQTYDLDWKAHPEYSVFTDHFRDGGDRIPRPECLEELLAVCADLSKGFPEVRLDFYIIKGKPVFGEFTFASNYGQMPFYTKEFLKELGDQVKLPERRNG